VTSAGVSAAVASAADWPAPHVAVGALWVSDGPASPPSDAHHSAPATPTVDRVRWGDTARVQPWASVSKLLVALAVLVAVEEGTLDLDEAAGPPGSTIRHLLAHASGLGPDGAVLAAPGRRRIYSNAGYEVLADTLADRAGMPFATYLAEGVLQPLGTTATRLPAGASPASGVAGPLDDLLVVAGTLLAVAAMDPPTWAGPVVASPTPAGPTGAPVHWDGPTGVGLAGVGPTRVGPTGAGPAVVAPSTLRMATEVAFTGLPGVVPGIGRFDPCDWGLGFELADAKVPHWTAATGSPRTFGHFGRSGSFLWVDPDAATAAVALTGRTFGSWALDRWPAWSDGVLRAVAVDRTWGAVPGSDP
jgi:CubicO group peptidase (beta-lactamase class C family)